MDGDQFRQLKLLQPTEGTTRTTMDFLEFTDKVLTALLYEVHVDGHHDDNELLGYDVV
jgi:hypothetical protein